MASGRMSKVNELIRKTLAEHTSEVLELSPGELITITNVITSKDLAHSKVFITLFPDSKKEFLLERIGLKAKELKYILSQNTSLQKVPDLRFVMDATEEKAQHMEDVLNTLS